MAILTLTGRYSKLRRVLRHVYAEDAEFSDKPIRKDRVFAQRFTTWVAKSGARSYVVKEGDTLLGISKKVFGSEKFWWTILDFNPQIDYALDLKPLSVIILPPNSIIGFVASKL